MKSQIRTAVALCTLLFALCASAVSQVPLNPAAVTVANLPSASLNKGKVYVVNDGAAAGDCTSGGGTAITWCRSSGSVWIALGDGLGSTALPSQTGHSGEFLTTNGTIASWASVGGGGDALVANPLSQFAPTTSLQLKNTISDETGSGPLVFGTSPNITTPTGIVKGDVGLGSADNTSDAAKPVSTAQQTALDLKANLASPIFTGTPSLPTGTIQAGSFLFTAIAAPSTPAAGKGSIYVDSTSKNLAVKDDAGLVKHGVQTKAAVSNSFLTAISDAGLVTVAQPAFTDISGSVAASQMPALTGYVSGAGTVAATDTILQAFQKLNGNALLLSPIASPTFTGVPAAPTAAVDTATTQLATTAYVVNQTYAKLASPAFSGTPSLPTGTTGVTQSAADSTTKLATTAFVTTADNLKANLISPSFTTPSLGAATAASLNITGQVLSLNGLARITDAASSGYTKLTPQNNNLIVYQGGTDQTFKVYNSGGSKAIVLGADSFGPSINSEDGSAVQMNASLMFLTDNTRDIGASGNTRPRNIFVAGSVVTKTKAGVPTDADVTNPADGMMMLDTTNHRIYFRDGGVWKYAALL